MEKYEIIERLNEGVENLDAAIRTVESLNRKVTYGVLKDK